MHQTCKLFFLPVLNYFYQNLFIQCLSVQYSTASQYHLWEKHLSVPSFSLYIGPICWICYGIRCCSWTIQHSKYLKHIILYKYHWRMKKCDICVNAWSFTTLSEEQNWSQNWTNHSKWAKCYTNCPYFMNQCSYGIWIL